MACLCFLMSKASAGEWMPGGDANSLGARILWKLLHQHAWHLGWDYPTAGLSQDCWPHYLQEASPCGLGFLTAWQPQDKWTFYMAAQGCKNKCFKEWGGSLIAFLHLASKVLYCHFFLYLSTVTSLPRFKDRGHGPQLLMGKVSKYFYPVSELIQVS